MHYRIRDHKIVSLSRIVLQICLYSTDGSAVSSRKYTIYDTVMYNIR